MDYPVTVNRMNPPKCPPCPPQKKKHPEKSFKKSQGSVNALIFHITFISNTSYEADVQKITKISKDIYPLVIQHSSGKSPCSLGKSTISMTIYDHFQIAMEQSLPEGKSHQIP